eukprot:365274-Chlamydomonas_euryale.AAC.15
MSRLVSSSWGGKGSMAPMSPHHQINVHVTKCRAKARSSISAFGRRHKAAAMSLEEATLDEDVFIELLGKLIGETRHLQNNAPTEVPVEDRGKATMQLQHIGAAPDHMILPHYTKCVFVCACARRQRHTVVLSPLRASACMLARTPTMHVLDMLVSSAGRYVLELLEPFSTENGGPLKIQHVTFVEGRGNIIGARIPR